MKYLLLSLLLFTGCVSEEIETKPFIFKLGQKVLLPSSLYDYCTGVISSAHHDLSGNKYYVQITCTNLNEDHEGYFREEDLKVL